MSIAFTTLLDEGRRALDNLGLATQQLHALAPAGIEARFARLIDASAAERA
jgi:hypothetical protein